ncbi:MAG: hypothetical protein IJU20_02085 [Clostridia bacterium]|nr:hypothetical protein [Clostridia bacterium]
MPSNYRKRYNKGELEQKNTFADRIISEVPKFVQKRLEKAHCAAVPSFPDVPGGAFFSSFPFRFF